MASGIFQSFMYDLITGEVDLDIHPLKIMLVTSAYVPNFNTHTKRSNVTNEVTGTGYTAGGKAATGTLVNDTANARITLTIANVDWAASTITARGAVIYLNKGGAASGDNLVAYVDFGSDKASVAGTFTFAATSPLILAR